MNQATAPDRTPAALFRVPVKTQRSHLCFVIRLLVEDQSKPCKVLGGKCLPIRSPFVLAGLSWDIT